MSSALLYLQFVYWHCKPSVLTLGEPSHCLFPAFFFLFYFISYLKSIFTQEQPLQLRISGLPHILLVQLCFLRVSMTTTGMCTSCLSSCQENRQSQTDKEKERNSKDARTFLRRSLWRVGGPEQIAFLFYDKVKLFY